MIRRGLAVVMTALFLFCGAARFASAENLVEEAIRKLATDNTITGRYMFGGWFSEYHAPDGRVLGNNGWQDNQDACWTTKSDAICYSYGEPTARQTYCFTVEQQGDSLLLRNSSNGSLNAIGKVESANPRNHSDNGKSWNCEDRLSRRDKNLPSTAHLITPLNRYVRERRS